MGVGESEVRDEEASRGEGAVGADRGVEVEGGGEGTSRGEGGGEEGEGGGEGG